MLTIHTFSLYIGKSVFSPLLQMEAELDTEQQEMMEGGFSRTMQIDPKRARFPCSIVWSPLPVISWFIPFIGHIGICREDGVILDFAGPNFVCVDNFAFGAATRYFQITKEKVSAIILFYFILEFTLYLVPKLINFRDYLFNTISGIL